MRVEKLGPARECGPKIPALTRPAATLEKLHCLFAAPLWEGRDRPAKEHGMLCFEMEAGLMQSTALPPESFGGFVTTPGTESLATPNGGQGSSSLPVVSSFGAGPKDVI